MNGKKLFFMITLGVMLSELIIRTLVVWPFFMRLAPNIQPTVFFSILCFMTFLLGFAKHHGYGKKAVEFFALIIIGWYSIFVTKLFLYRYNPAFFSATPEQILAFNEQYANFIHFITGGYTKQFCVYPCFSQVILHAIILLSAVVATRLFFDEQE